MLLRLKKNETNRSCKSLSGSIKKHIFHNTLVSKTPKRCSTTSTGSNNVRIEYNHHHHETNIPFRIRNFNSKINFALQTPTNSRPLEDITKPRIVFQTPTIYETRVKLSTNEPFQIPAISLSDSDASHQHHYPINSPIAVNSIKDDVSSATIVDDKENEQTNQKTPMSASSKLINNKHKTFYKSEPNLSKILFEKNSTPIINRGKHIAKKLFSSVSMINLRRPFCGTRGQEQRRESIESHNMDDRDAEFDDEVVVMAAKTTAAEAAVKTTMPKTLLNLSNCVSSTSMDQIQEISNSSMADDSSKDLSSPDEMNMIGSIGRESESPITKSTHRMSKAMQVS